MYGGLFKLLCGNSDTFSFQLTWMEQNIKNPYERIEWWADDYFWNHIEMFMAVRFLYDIQPELFEKLVLEDKSRVILLIPGQTLLEKHIGGQANNLSEAQHATQLVLEDKSRVILRSMAHGHMDIRPTDVLLQKLFSNKG